MLTIQVIYANPIDTGCYSQTTINHLGDKFNTPTLTALVHLGFTLTLLGFNYFGKKT